MNIPSGFRSCRFAAIVLLLMALATLPALADDTGPKTTTPRLRGALG